MRAWTLPTRDEVDGFRAARSRGVWRRRLIGQSGLTTAARFDSRRCHRVGRRQPAYHRIDWRLSVGRAVAALRRAARCRSLIAPRPAIMTSPPTLLKSGEVALDRRRRGARRPSRRSSERGPGKLALPAHVRSFRGRPSASMHRPAGRPRHPPGGIAGAPPAQQRVAGNFTATLRKLNSLPAMANDARGDVVVAAKRAAQLAPAAATNRRARRVRHRSSGQQPRLAAAVPHRSGARGLQVSSRSHIESAVTNVAGAVQRNQGRATATPTAIRGRMPSLAQHDSARTLPGLDARRGVDRQHANVRRAAAFKQRQQRSNQSRRR